MPSDDPRRQLATEIAMLAARELLARLPEAEGMMKESDQVDVSVGVKFRRDKRGKMGCTITVGAPRCRRPKPSRMLMELTDDQLALFNR
ncbi:MAG: hypothetical protein ACYTGV_17215 [Planctomycetota bacterium]|jgi:hypothetical protein